MSVKHIRVFLWVIIGLRYTVRYMSLETNGQFTNPHDEIAFLRAELARRELGLQHEQPVVSETDREKIAHDIVSAYKKTQPDKILHNDHRMSTQDVGAVSLNLEPETHDSQIESLYALMLANGVRNAFSVIQKLGDSHLDDDFHRFLVQYLLTSNTLPGVAKNTELYQELNMTLYQVTLPEPDEKTKSRPFRELIAAMEQFLYGMQSVTTTDASHDRWFSLECAVPVGTTQVTFYVCVPNTLTQLFQKQLFGFFPDAKVEPVPNETNVFVDGGVTVGAQADSITTDLLAIRTWDKFENDPLDVLVAAFGNIARDDEGALLQVVIHPRDDGFQKNTARVLEEVKKGKKFSDARRDTTFWSVLSGMAKGSADNTEEKKSEYRFEDEQAVDAMVRKLKSPIAQVSIRIVVSSGQQFRADQMLQEILSVFNQYNEPYAGGLKFDLIRGRDLFGFAHDTIYRSFGGKVVHLNMSEIATLFHFPARISDSPHLMQSRAATAPPPVDAPTAGVLIGYNEHRGQVTPMYMNTEDRMRHLYVIGQTGTGKTGILMNMIAQDIANGDGLCFVDPHGSDIQTILSMIPPERAEDVVYFDPSYLPRPMGLNMLEYDPTHPEQKSLIIDTMMTMFNQLFDMKTSGGPLFEQYFKNSAFLVMEHPESGCTLLEVTRVLADKEFRDMKLRHCANPIIKQFWTSAEKTKGEQALENFVPYISSKFDPLISNEFLRPIIVQEKSAFNVRELMDNKKILLVNLSKGLLGELNANLIGMIIVAKIQMAALSRVDSYGQKLADFYLYIDEFQNVTTPAIASILSEARKYRLSLNVAHQYMKQLDEKIKAAVLGNVGSIASFRISPEDAKELEQYFGPTFTPSDIVKLENRNAYIKMLANGTPITPFNIKTADYPPRNPDMIDPIKQLSYLRFGRDRSVVEAEIMAKYERKDS